MFHCIYHSSSLQNVQAHVVRLHQPFKEWQVASNDGMAIDTSFSSLRAILFDRVYPLSEHKSLHPWTDLRTPVLLKRSHLPSERWSIDPVTDSPCVPVILQCIRDRTKVFSEGLRLTPGTGWLHIWIYNLFTSFYVKQDPDMSGGPVWWLCWWVSLRIPIAAGSGFGLFHPSDKVSDRMGSILYIPVLFLRYRELRLHEHWVRIFSDTASFRFSMYMPDAQTWHRCDIWPLLRSVVREYNDWQTYWYAGVSSGVCRKISFSGYS